MRIRLPAIAVLAATLAACQQPPPAAPFAPEAMTFPSSSKGAKDHFHEQAIAMCRQAANPDDPDCVLRVKGNGGKCASTAVPAVFQTKIEYDDWTARYLKCLGAPELR